jgi:hypothetical protein
MKSLIGRSVAFLLVSAFVCSPVWATCGGGGGEAVFASLRDDQAFLDLTKHCGRTFCPMPMSPRQAADMMKMQH